MKGNRRFIFFRSFLPSMSYSKIVHSRGGGYPRTLLVKYEEIMEY